MLSFASEFLRNFITRVRSRLVGHGKLCVAWEKIDVDGTVIASGLCTNLITNVGRQQWHLQNYGGSGLASVGFTYMAASADAVTETSASTTLSNEITTNGFARAATTNTLPTGAGNQTEIRITWTASNTQSVQKVAMFNASSGGIMNHVFALQQGSQSFSTGQKLSILGVVTSG